MKAGPRLPTSGDSGLILIQSCRSFSEVKHCTGPHLWTLPAAFKKLCSNKHGPVTATSSARNVMRLEQIWAVGRLLMGLHAQKKQCFVLDSWIITVTTEHGATCANSKMRPEDSLMHHDLRFCCMFLPEKGSWQGRLEAQGFRRLAPLRMSAFISFPKQLWGPVLTSPSQSIAQLWEKITEAVVFIKNVYETACKEKGRLATPLSCRHLVEHVRSLLISPVTPIFFDRKVSSSYIPGHGVVHSLNFNATCYSVPG